MPFLAAPAAMPIVTALGSAATIGANAAMQSGQNYPGLDAPPIENPGAMTIAGQYRSAAQRQAQSQAAHDAQMANPAHVPTAADAQFSSTPNMDWKSPFPKATQPTYAPAFMSKKFVK